MTGLINAIIYAKDTGRTFFLDDSKWNYGRWDIFFVKLPKPGCVRPDKTKKVYDGRDDDDGQVVFAQFPDYPLLMKDLNKMDRSFTNAPHQIMTHWSWHLLDEHLLSRYTNTSRDGDDDNKQESVLSKIWRPNREVRRLTHDQSYEIGIPHNHGGMRPENPYIAFQIHHDEVTVFITSRKEISEVRRALSFRKPNWQFITSFEDEPMYRFDAAQKPRLMSYRLDSRINFGMALIADITLMSQADHLVCTFSAPLCRFLVVLKGWKAATMNTWEAGGTTPIDDGTNNGWFPTLYSISKDGKSTNPHNAYWI
ncbi:4433_t:CDS:2, partial [Ambispora gerdemannii]